MNEITYKLGNWFDLNHRDLPWRRTRDAYRIWLSEVILQQTRVSQGWDYYLRFVKEFPTVEALAQAPLDTVLKLWQGLGYYSRARNLHEAARQVVARHREMGMRGEVQFPTHFADLLTLKGVGRYTAAAIASLSADEVVAVVDGNVYRVLSRLFDIDTPIDTGKGQREFQTLADELLREEVELNHGRSSRHNQAMMEFGALHCTPANPRCDVCPLAQHCLALVHGTTELRPIKQSKVQVRERHLHYTIYIYKELLWVRQRKAGDIWQGLWEFVLEEGDRSSEAGIELLTMKHQLTHQTLYADFRVVRLPDNADPMSDPAIQALPSDYQPMSWADWQQCAVSRLIEEANKRLSAWF